MLTDPATAPAEIARVLRSARERSLPVYIEFPRDMVDAPNARRCRCCRARRSIAEALAECADEILARLRAAKAPVIMVDVEIRRYGIEEHVAALARKLGCRW